MGGTRVARRGLLVIALARLYDLQGFGYGMLRVGNKVFADCVDAHIADSTHVNNKRDPVPVVPGSAWVYLPARRGVYTEPRNTVSMS